MTRSSAEYTREYMRRYRPKNRKKIKTIRDKWQQSDSGRATRNATSRRKMQ